MFFEKFVKRPLSLNKGTAQKEQLQWHCKKWWSSLKQWETAIIKSMKGQKGNNVTKVDKAFLKDDNENK